ncbi:MAG: S41 family peptidase [Chitinophagaceae bacterium]
MKKMTCLLFILFCLSGYLLAQNETSLKLTAATRNALIDSIANALNSYYVFPDKAKAITGLLKEQLQRGKYDALVSATDFANKVMADIRAVYNDKHLVIRFDPGLQQRILSFNTTKKADKADFEKEQRQNFYFKKLEILPLNTGYIEFTNFSDTSETARETIRAAMQFVAHTNALILDLRNNYGGNGMMAGEIAGYFFGDSIYTGRSYNRIENKWTGQWVKNKPVVTGGLVMKMPIYILTSKRTFSAAEGLAYTLQQFRKAMVVGDTTRGGAHLTRSFSVGNGFVAFIPISRSENAITKTDWEGTGVLPGTRESEENSLIAAQKMILQASLAVVTDENERKKINWQVNYLHSRTALQAFAKADLQKFTGQFEEFSFSIEGDQLICSNLHKKDHVDRLLTISSTMFQVDNEAQVEFVLNDKGACDVIKLYWNDGWVDTISRTR